MTTLNSKLLQVPRGNPNSPPLSLEMSRIYDAERRLEEVKSVTPLTAPELRGYYNEITNLTTKYIAWITYEILQAKKHVQLAKAEVILDKLPEEIKRLKETGVKDNADYRDAFVIRDSGYQSRLDTLNGLEAVRELLEAKAKTFERAYWDCRDVANSRDRIAATPNFSHGSSNVTSEESAANIVNFMGTTKY